MTLIDLSLAEITRKCAGDVMYVSWSATRTSFDGHRHHFGRERFVLSIQMLNASSAMLEAWIESPFRERSVMPRTLGRLEAAIDRGLVHFDAYENGDEKRMIARLTLRQLSSQNDFELLFAQSSLLAEAGFVAGAYDPPNLKLIAKQHSAALA